MADRSNIEWTDATWNPIVGCTIVSPGCTNCYAQRMAARLEAIGREHYAGTTRKVNGHAVWTGKVAIAPKAILTAPLRWKRPRRIFVNSMGDLFHESIPYGWIDRVFAVMALCPQHTFQVLTKRAERMRRYMEKLSEPDSHGNAAENIRVVMTALAGTPSRRKMAPVLKAIPYGKYCAKIAWPLPNCWLGVSAERQQEADERLPDLLETPAAVRFISCEPLLGPIDIDPFIGSPIVHRVGTVTVDPDRPGWSEWEDEEPPRILRGVDWVIVGGESGPGARPFDIDWARSILRQCSAAGTPAFMKQLGSNPYSDGRPMHGAPRGKYRDPAAWPPELRQREMP